MPMLRTLLHRGRRGFVRLRGYVRLLWEIGLDSLWRFRMTTALALACGFGGLMIQIFAIGVAASYAHLLNQGEPVAVHVLRVEPRESLLLLVGAAGLVLLALLCSAVLQWIAGRRTIQLRRSYQDFCTARVFRRLVESPFVLLPGEDQSADFRPILMVARGDAAFCGRVVHMLADAIVPVVTTLLAFGTLFYLELWPTLLILSIVSVSMFFIYRANVHAVSSTRTMERLAPHASRAFRRRVIQLRDDPYAGLNEQERLDEAWFEREGGVRAYFDARDGRFLAIQSSRFTGNVFLAMIMFVIILTMGGALILEGRNWSRLIIYLFALQHGLFSLRTVTSMITSINRFYPQLKRYRDFLALTEPRDRGRVLPLAEYAVRARAPSIPGSVAEHRARVGQRLLLLCPVEANRYTAGYLLDMLVGPGREALDAALFHATYVTSRKYVAADRALRDALGFAPHRTRADLEALVSGSPLVASVPEDFERCVGADAWEAMPGTMKFLLGAMAAVDDPGAQWIFLGDASLRKLPEVVRTRLLEMLRDRIVVVVSRDPGCESLADPDVVVVVSDDHVVGMGDGAWRFANLGAIRTLVEQDVDEGRDGRMGDEDEDLDDFDVMG